MLTTPLVVATLVAAGQTVAVLPLQQRRIEAELVAVLNDLLVSELDERSDDQILGHGDIEAMLGLEKMKDALGCDDVACAVELGGALGARFLVTGSVSSLGDELIVQLTKIDTQNTEVVARATAAVPNRETEYAAAIRQAVRNLLELPSPKERLQLVFDGVEGLHYRVNVVSADGVQHRCEGKPSSGCRLTDLEPGQARLVVTSENHTPYVETIKLTDTHATVAYQIESATSTGSWLLYLSGGTSLFVGSTLTLLGSVSDLGRQSVIRGIGIGYLAVGLGLVGAGLLLNPVVDVQKATLSERLSVAPLADGDSLGLGAAVQW